MCVNKDQGDWGRGYFSPTACSYLCTLAPSYHPFDFYLDFHSKVVTAYSRMFDVTASSKEIKQIITHHKLEWIRYGYFEFTKPEYIKPHQRVIAMKQVGLFLTYLESHNIIMYYAYCHRMVN